MEANASLRGLARRNSGTSYWAYLKELARQEEVDPEDPAAVARFDRKRPGRKTSNKNWHNLHDPDAKVGHQTRRLRHNAQPTAGRQPAILL